MVRDEYYKKSQSEGLPKRCPILSRCARRAHSIYLLSYTGAGSSIERRENPVNFLIRSGELPANYLEVEIGLAGEQPTIYRADDYFDYFDLCPEIILFDSSHTPFFIPIHIASTSGSWNKSSNGSAEFKSHKSGHYSECGEYSAFTHELPKQRKPKLKRQKLARKNIPVKLRFTVLARDNHTCMYCGRISGNGVVLYIDHKKSLADGGDNSLENLITSCQDCNLGKGARSIV